MPQAKSSLEAEFAVLYASVRYLAAEANRPLPPLTPQFRFHPTRKWRLDFAVPELRVACELQGMYSPDGEESKHRRVAGMLNDYAKYNAAQELGWVVLLAAKPMISDVVDQFVRVIRLREG